jgi:hypothetical protein
MNEIILIKKRDKKIKIKQEHMIELINTNNNIK